MNELVVNAKIFFRDWKLFLRLLDLIIGNSFFADMIDNSFTFLFLHYFVIAK